MDVLLLARELQADLVLIDEKLGRRIAGILGLRVQGREPSAYSYAPIENI